MKPSKAFLAVLLSGLASTETQAWALSTRIDAMTDKQVSVVSVQSKDGARLTVLRKSDNSVWGYLSLGGTNQFAVDQEILLRVDKHEPVDFSEDLDKLTRSLGITGVSWEWNPNLVGFKIWHGAAEEGGCGMISQFLGAKTLIARYKVDRSRSRDIFFDISKPTTPLLRALSISTGDCKPYLR